MDSMVSVQALSGKQTPVGGTQALSGKQTPVGDSHSPGPVLPCSSVPTGLPSTSARPALPCFSAPMVSATSCPTMNVSALGLPSVHAGLPHLDVAAELLPTLPAAPPTRPQGSSSDQQVFGLGSLDFNGVLAVKNIKCAKRVSNDARVNDSIAGSNGIGAKDVSGVSGTKHLKGGSFPLVFVRRTLPDVAHQLYLHCADLHWRPSGRKNIDSSPSHRG